MQEYTKYQHVIVIIKAMVYTKYAIPYTYSTFICRLSVDTFERVIKALQYA